MVGYPCVNEHGTESFDPKYLCPSCEQVLRDPVQTTCGHRYCSSCVEELLRSPSSRCLIDKEEIKKEQIFKDRFAQREILSLAVQCKNQAEGCAWRGELRHFEDHEMECALSKVKCMHPNCEVVVLRKELNRHVFEECLYRQVQCKLCKVITTVDKLEEHRENDCPECPVDCPKCVNVKLLRKKLSTHLHPVIGDCEAVMIPCPFHVIGCPDAELRKRKETRDHMTNGIAFHLGLLLLSFQGIRLNEMPRLDDHDARMVNLSLDAQAQNIKINSLERQLGMANEEIRNLQLQSRITTGSTGLQEIPSYDGVLLWKITDFARRRNEAITDQHMSIFSPIFYTSRHGYKMCARIYLNGEGMGQGTHISLFLIVMRGDYDALLRWPFRQKVTFMLLDQDNVEHVIDAFRPDPSSSSFQRPRRETNIASGCPTFCPLSELNNHAYVREDTLFIKVIVDTTNDL